MRFGGAHCEALAVEELRDEEKRRRGEDEEETTQDYRPSPGRWGSIIIMMLVVINQ